MKKSLPLFLVVILFSVSFPVLAQEPGPPKVLLIVREEIKPGMMVTHARHSAEFVNIFSNLQTSNYRLALVPVAGNENEVIYLTGGKSFAEIESINRATDKKMEVINGRMKVKMDALNKEAPALHSAMRDILAVYRPDLSFNPGVSIPQMRYFSITTTRVRPGHDATYADYVQKIINIARDKAKVENLHVAVFQVVSGAPGGTYLIFRPMKSLAEMDDPIGMKVRAGMSEDQRKEADKAVREAVMSSDVSTYAFAPSMSYVEKEFIAADPAFWGAKPAMAVKPKPKKRAPKPATPSPAN